MSHSPSDVKLSQSTVCHIKGVISRISQQVSYLTTMSTGRANKRLSMPFPDELPTIVVVQGSFQTPQVYEKFEQSLASLGYPVVHPLLPSCHEPDDANFPNRTLVDDAYSVRQELSRLIERQGKTVSVVMHGYGGLVGSEAIIEQFNFATRQSQDLLGGVVHLFYVSACIFAEGQSMLSTFEESLNVDATVGNPALSDS